jgi:hypothetical protein
MIYFADHRLLREEVRSVRPMDYRQDVADDSNTLKIRFDDDLSSSYFLR